MFTEPSHKYLVTPFSSPLILISLKKKKKKKKLSSLFFSFLYDINHFFYSNKKTHNQNKTFTTPVSTLHDTIVPLFATKRVVGLLREKKERRRRKRKGKIITERCCSGSYWPASIIR
jgi:hypothetical protein